MGCASSSPLVESGKNLVDVTKQGVDGVMAQGEKALHEMEETAMDGINTGMEHVKDSVESAVNTAENSLGSVISKIGGTVNSTMDNVEDAAENAIHKTTEAVSEAETELASEVEDAKDFIDSTAEDAKEGAFQKIDSAKKSAMENIEDLDGSLQIEDMDEHFDGLGNDVQVSRNKIEEIVARLPTPAMSPEPVKEAKPTFWEAAHDEILQQRSKSIDKQETENDKELPTKMFELKQKANEENLQ